MNYNVRCFKTAYIKINEEISCKCVANKQPQTIEELQDVVHPDGVISVGVFFV